jgi:hypothetical protein
MNTLKISTPTQPQGLIVFTLGTLEYFGSWLLLIFLPASDWSLSGIGFAAPAFTPALWLIGLAMIGRQLYWENWYLWWIYLVVAGGFLFAHIWHTALIFNRANVSAIKLFYR